MSVEETTVERLAQASDDFEASENAAREAAAKAAQEVQDAEEERLGNKPPDDSKSEKEKYAEKIHGKNEDDEPTDDDKAEAQDGDENAPSVEGEETESEDDQEPAEAKEDKPAKKLTRKERRRQWKLEQEKRIRDGLSRERKEHERVLAEMRAERVALDTIRKERADLERIREEMRRNPMEAAQRHFGVDPEHIAAAQLEDGGMSPAVQREIQQIRQQNDELRKLLTGRLEQEERAKAERDHQMRVEHDIRNILSVNKSPQAEEYEYFCALHPADQERLARQYHAKALRENPDIRLWQLLDELDEAAEPIVQHYRGRRRKPAKGNSEGKAKAEGSREQNGSKSPGRGRARAAAEPANRGELTEAQLRQNALRVAKEATKN